MCICNFYMQKYCSCCEYQWYQPKMCKCLSKAITLAAFWYHTDLYKTHHFVVFHCYNTFLINVFFLII